MIFVVIEHRARVPELAAERGEKGFSGVVAEALDLYLTAQNGRTDAIWVARAMRGDTAGMADGYGSCSQTTPQIAEQARLHWLAASPQAPSPPHTLNGRLPVWAGSRFRRNQSSGCRWRVLPATT